MKKLLFVIYTSGGNGGHYRSMISLITSLQGLYETYIVNIGRTISPVINNSGFNFKFVYFDKTNWRSVSSDLIQIIKDYGIDIIHAYDYLSYDAVFDSASSCKIPLVLTKCGGPIIKYKILFPRVENLILFSKEDYSYFTKRRGFPNISLIPNRVLPFESDNNKIEKIKENYKLTGGKIIIRIGRIGPAYIRTAEQSINLVKLLHSIDPNYVLLLIGSVDDPNTLDKLNIELENIPYVHIVTDPYFTNDARCLLEMADIVVGTGRGFMEGCAKNKIMFAPTCIGDFPIPVSSEVFENIFAYNFSERYRPDSTVQTDSILDYIQNHPDSITWYKEYFDMFSARPKYEKIYSSLLSSNKYKRFDVLASKAIITLSALPLLKKTISAIYK